MKFQIFWQWNIFYLLNPHLFISTLHKNNLPLGPAHLLLAYTNQNCLFQNNLSRIYIFHTLVLSGPAGPNWHKSGLNRVLYPTVSGRFSKRPSYVRSSHQCSHLGIALNLSGISEMGSLLIIVVKLYSYKDSDVGNIRTIKFFRDYCRPIHNAWNTI